MNEINETFTKQINGFECSINASVSTIEASNTVWFYTVYAIIKNNKFVEMRFRSSGFFGLYESEYCVRQGDKEKKSCTYFSTNNTNILFLKIFNPTIYDEKQSIWQILQDEWHKRFGDE